MDFHIRMADPCKDSDVLGALEQQIYQSADRFSPEDWSDYECSILSFYERNIGTLAVRQATDLAEDRGEFVTSPGTLFCGSIGIVPEYQGFGFGSLLMAALIVKANLSGCLRIVSNVRESTARSIRLHEKFHFRRIRSIPDFYKDPAEAAVVLELLLHQPMPRPA